jgi:signal peptidase I
MLPVTSNFMTDLLNDELKFQLKTRPRNASIAFLLSLVLPGLGQIYNGQLKKGILFFGLYLLNPLLFGISRGATYFYGYVFLFLIELIIRAYILFDAIKNAKRKKFYIPKSYNTWYYQLSIAILMGIVLWVYDTKSILGIQSFHIPTPSSQPTIQIGDRLIADMQAYKKTQPNYGDIVVFKKENDQIYAFRIVGLPKDTVDLVDNIVTINRKQSKSTFIKETTSEEFQVTEFEEEFPNGQKHKIYKSKQPFDTTKSNMQDIIVPDNSYYLLGDNRDNAADSRYDGFVNKSKIVGRIVFSYWGQSTDRINLNFRNK